MFRLLDPVIQAIQPFLAPLGLVIAWTLIFMVGWIIWAAIRDTVQRAKVMHQIPCTHCEFFTNDHRLKCTLHPAIANTERAIDCSEYSPAQKSLIYPVNVNADSQTKRL